jgi:nucleoid DNA-binding protein
MTRKEMVDGFRDYVNARLKEGDPKMTYATAEATLDAVTGYFYDSLLQGKEINIMKFFKMGIKNTGERNIKEVRSGELKKYPSIKVPYVKFSRSFKERIKKVK